MKLLLLSIFLGVFVGQLYTKDIEHEPIQSCYGTTCPEGSILCKRTTKTSEDLKTLTMNIKCLGSKGEVLFENKTEKANAFEGVEISSVSIHGIFKLPDIFGNRRNDTNLLSPAPDSEILKNRDTENIETFD